MCLDENVKVDKPYVTVRYWDGGFKRETFLMKEVTRVNNETSDRYFYYHPGSDVVIYKEGKVVEDVIHSYDLDRDIVNGKYKGYNVRRVLEFL